MANIVSISRACRSAIRFSVQSECKNTRIPPAVSVRFSQQRNLRTSSAISRPPDFAFAFDIDGVLLRSHDPIPRAHEALALLQSHGVPFLLLTNGGGHHDKDRVEKLSEKLKIPLDTDMFIQSHTPFADMERFKDKTIMVIGGEGDNCRQVAEKYGFNSVVTPADVLIAHPSIWPFSSPFMDYYRSFARPLPQPIDASNPKISLKIDGIFVYNDPRDWGLDAAVIIDLLLSASGRLGTISTLNNNPSLPNRGYLQDHQPPLYFCNPDLWWAAEFHLPRLGQGAFREALEGIWTAVTGGEKNGVLLMKEVIGKPFQKTFEFAEKKLIRHHKSLLQDREVPPLTKIYMVGDNPESDIRGGNCYKSHFGISWSTILVRTGVYPAGGVPAWEPSQTVSDVFEAVQWALAEQHGHHPSVRKN